MYQYQSTKNNFFTLLEMLLVILIMGLTASTLLISVGNSTDQHRYDTTSRQSRIIKKTIVGESTLTQHTTTIIKSFVADIGRLPNDLNELFNAGTNTLMSYNSETGLRHGWNGPYLTNSHIIVETLESGEAMILDAWGNYFTYNNTETSATITSKGKDMSDGGDDTYEQDYVASIYSNECITLYAGEKLEFSVTINGLLPENTTFKVITPDNAEQEITWSADSQSGDTFTTTFAYTFSLVNPMFWQQLSLAIYDTSGPEDQLEETRLITLTPGAHPSALNFTVTIEE